MSESFFQVSWTTPECTRQTFAINLHFVLHRHTVMMLLLEKHYITRTKICRGPVLNMKVYHERNPEDVRITKSLFLSLETELKRRWTIIMRIYCHFKVHKQIHSNIMFPVLEEKKPNALVCTLFDEVFVCLATGVHQMWNHFPRHLLHPLFKLTRHRNFNYSWGYKQQMKMYSFLMFIPSTNSSGFGVSTRI